MKQLDRNRQRLLDIGLNQCLKRDSSRGGVFIRVTENGDVEKASADRDGEFSAKTIGKLTPNPHTDSMELQLELANNEYDVVPVDEYPA